jgi:hypothetical protein
VRKFIETEKVDLQSIAPDLGLQIAARPGAGKPRSGVRRLQSGRVSLLDARPDIAALLHQNQPVLGLTAENTAVKSNVEVRLKCPQHPDGFVMKLCNVTRYSEDYLRTNPQCNFCSSHKLSEDNNLLARYPAMVKALWDYEKNGTDLEPSKLMPNDTKVNFASQFEVFCDSQRH